MTMTCPRCGARDATAVAECPSCSLPLRPFATERRHATVLFADLCGSTSFAADRDPEEVHAVVDRCLVTMSDIVAHYGGTVTRVVGDEVMAVFGAPVTHGDDAERATRAALAITSADLGGQAVRVGVNTGEVFVAPLGTGEARQFTVSGAPVNLAARLREQAPENAVLVGEQTRQATRNVIEHSELSGLALKGVDAPVTAWTPIAAGSAPGRPLSRAPFVGRERERELIRCAWQDVRESGNPRLVAVTGPPGIGKSRLVAEATNEIAADGGVVGRGRCLPYGRPTPYDAVAPLLRGLAGVSPDAEPDAARARLEAWLAERDRTRDPGHLRLLAGLAHDTDSVVDLQALVGALVGVVEAGQVPALLVVEDLHWSSAGQLTLLDHTIARIRRGPVLIVTLARPELADRFPEWGTRAGGLVRIDLEPLPARAGLTLASWLLGPNQPADLAERVVAEAAGVPLFVEELAVQRHDQPTVDALPGTVQDAIAARLDTLPAPARNTALAAAVLGSRFTPRALTAVSDSALDDALTLLALRGIVQDDGAGTVEFRHALIRDVAYHTLPRAQRQALHERAARYLEEHPGDPIRTAEMLAHHWEHAGDIERTLTHLLDAAAIARQAWAKQDAVQWYEKATALLPANDPRQQEIELQRGLTLVEQGDYPRVLEVLGELAPRLDGTPRIQALLGLSHAAFWTMDTTRALRVAVEAAERAEPGSPLRVRAEAARSAALSVEDTWSAAGAREGEAVLAAWPADAPTHELTGLLGLLSNCHYWTGDYPAAQRRGREGYRLAVRAHDIDGALVAASALGLGLVGMGRHEEALEVYAEAVALGYEYELVPRMTARLVSMWGGALRELGDTAAARERAAEASELAQAARFPFPPLQSRIDVLCCDLLDGDVAQAERAWPDLQEQARAMRGWHNWLTLGRLAVARAEIALVTDKTEDAIATAAEAEAYARHTCRTKYVIAAQQVQGRALLALGRVAPAVTVLTDVAAGARTLGHPPAQWQAEAALARALTAVGRDDEAERHGQAARETLDAFAGSLAPQRRRTLLGSPAAVL